MSHSDKLALAVDLDGTLVLGDTLLESALRALRQNWTTVFLIPFWLRRGKAYLKQELARVGGIDASTLPYNRAVMDYLLQEKVKGRPIVLVTASDTQIAKEVAAHLKVFDDVLCSDGILNLKGKTKASLLESRFGAGRFIYMGNDASDVEVWKRAGSAILVNASPSVARKARSIARVEFELPRATNHWRALLSAMRIYQWVKNLLVFVAPAAGHTLLQADTGLLAIQTFLAFNLVASGVYLANDLADLEADRKHIHKSRRPFASGALPLIYGIVSPVLLVGGLVWAFLISSDTGLVLLLYVTLTNTYSLTLKTKPLVDVFSLSALYSMRLVAGAIATSTAISIWLLSFSGFVFLALAFLKRTEEIISAAASRLPRRDYTHVDSSAIQIMGIASSFASSLVLALYVDSDNARLIYPAYNMLWGIVPLILFWQCRLWLSTVRGHMREDPIVYTATDWVSWITFGLIFILLGAAMFGPSLPLTPAP